MIHLAERNRAIERLVVEERGRILRYLSALRVPPSNREDLLQSGLVLLLQKWDSVEDPFSWLLGALRNLSVLEVAVLLVLVTQTCPTTGGSPASATTR